MSSPKPLCGALAGFILVRFLVFWIIANRFPNHRTAWTPRPEYSIVSIPAPIEPPVRSLRATCPATQSHLKLPSETLFHGALDMSLHGICIYGKAASLSRWACLPKRTSLPYAYSYKEPFAA